jgi:hypothetical protein
MLRATGVLPPITREEPEGTRDAPVLALTVTDGRTQDGAHRATTMVSRSSVHAEEHLPAEPSTDLEVNGPRWDNHFVDMVLESDDATNSRTRVMHQANRRVIHRGRNARATDGTGAIATSATDGTIHSPAASGAAFGKWHSELMARGHRSIEKNWR